MTDMVMHEKIRKARISEGLSQTELANATGMDASRIISCEQGQETPDTDEQILLSRVLGVSVYYLRHEDSNNPNNLFGAQDAIIEFYQRFGEDALCRYEQKLREMLCEAGCG